MLVNMSRGRTGFGRGWDIGHKRTHLAPGCRRDGLRAALALPRSSAQAGSGRPVSGVSAARKPEDELGVVARQPGEWKWKQQRAGCAQHCVALLEHGLLQQMLMQRPGMR